MKVNLNQVFQAIQPRPDGTTDMREQDPITGEDRPFTLRSVLLQTVLGGAPDEKMTGQKRVEYYKLAKRVRDADEFIELELAHVADLLRRVDELQWPTMITGQAHEMLDSGTSTPPALPAVPEPPAQPPDQPK